MTPTMIIDALLKAERPEVVARWAAGELERYGGILRVKKGFPSAGRIVAHLKDAAESSRVPSPDFVSLAGLAKVGAAASVLNLGVSVAGFVLVLHKLGKLQDQIAGLERFATARFDSLDARLDGIASQLVELRYVQACHGDVLAESLRNLHRLHTDRSLEHIAAIRAEVELLARDGVPTATRVESAERTFRAARHFCALSLATHGVRRDNPAEWPELLMRFRGWCLAVSVDVTLQRRAGRLKEAASVARESSAMAREWVSNWCATLLPTTEYHGAYRFGHRHFAELPREVVQRLIRLQTGEAPSAIAPLELVASRELSHDAPGLEADWWKRELGIAELLDFAEETTARLESLASEMLWCADNGLSWQEWEALPMPKEQMGVVLVFANGAEQ